jgi:hypothetical protein
MLMLVGYCGLLGCFICALLRFGCGCLVKEDEGLVRNNWGIYTPAGQGDENKFREAKRNKSSWHNGVLRI